MYLFLTYARQSIPQLFFDLSNFSADDYQTFKNIFLFLCAIWLFLELLFYLAIRLVASELCRNLTVPQKYEVDPEKLVEKIIVTCATLKSYSLQKFFSGWFLGANFEDIYVGNYRAFMAWVMYAKFEVNLTGEENNALDNTLRKIFSFMEISPKEGYNYNITHCHMTLEPLHYLHRPLLMYVMIGLKNFITCRAMETMGFQRVWFNGLKYWYKPCISCPTSEMSPMLYFHGICTGWCSYLSLIRSCSQNKSIFLIDIDAIKVNSLKFTFPSQDDFCANVCQIIKRHGYSKVNVVGHSFGTITAGWFVRRYPDQVNHLTLIDPVSLLLAHPEVASNFLYRKPTTVIEWLIYLFASSEITIANALRRHFFWYNKIFWLEDVPSNVPIHVSLAGHDEVSNTEAISEYVTRCADARRERKEASITLSVRAGHSHGQICICSNSIRALSKALHMEQKCSSPSLRTTTFIDSSSD